MAEVAVIMTGEEAKLWRAQQKILAQTKELEEKYKRVGAEGKKAGDSGASGARKAEQSQRGLSASLDKAIRQYVSMEAAITLAGNALRYYNEQNQKAKADVERLEEVRRPLRQIATSAPELQRLEERADELARAEGIDRLAAREILFNAMSGGFGEFASEIARLSPVVAPTTAAGMIGKFKGMFPQMTPEQSVNAAIAASSAAFANVEEIARAAPAAAPGVTMAGGTPEEMFALLSVLGDVAKSADVAADRIKGIGTKIGLNADLAGEGIISAVEKLSKMTEESRREFLKQDIETNEAYLWITSNLPKIRQRLAEVSQAVGESGTRASLMQQRIAAVYDPTTEQGRLNQAMRERNRQRANLEIETEKRAAAAFDREAAKIEATTRTRTRSRQWAGEFFGSAAGSTAEAIGAPAAVVGGVTEAAGRVPVSGFQFFNPLMGRSLFEWFAEATGLEDWKQSRLRERASPVQPAEPVLIQRGRTFMTIPANEMQPTDRRVPSTQQAAPQPTEQGAAEMRQAANQLSLAARQLSDAARLQTRQPQSFARGQRRQAEVPV